VTKNAATHNQELKQANAKNQTQQKPQPKKKWHTNNPQPHKKGKNLTF